MTLTQHYVAKLQAQMRARPIKVLYLDLDGTVRKGFDELGRFVNHPSDVEVFPEAVAAMREAKDAGWKIVAVSNQGGLALGHLTWESCVESMLMTQKLCGGLFDRILWCCHHPDAVDPVMSVCWCRKPRIGMILDGASEIAREFDVMCPPSMAVFVGDRQEDRMCAENAGIRFLWAKDWRAGAR